MPPDLARHSEILWYESMHFANTLVVLSNLSVEGAVSVQPSSTTTIQHDKSQLKEFSPAAAKLSAQGSCIGSASIFARQPMTAVSAVLLAAKNGISHRTHCCMAPTATAEVYQPSANYGCTAVGNICRRQGLTVPWDPLGLAGLWTARGSPLHLVLFPVTMAQCRPPDIRTLMGAAPSP